MAAAGKRFDPIIIGVWIAQLLLILLLLLQRGWDRLVVRPLVGIPVHYGTRTCVSHKATLMPLACQEPGGLCMSMIPPIQRQISGGMCTSMMPPIQWQISGGICMSMIPPIQRQIGGMCMIMIPPIQRRFRGLGTVLAIMLAVSRILMVPIPVSDLCPRQQVVMDKRGKATFPSTQPTLTIAMKIASTPIQRGPHLLPTPSPR